jgi:hypothetical protein
VVIEVLKAHARAAVCVRIVAPAEYARVGEVVREEVAQPIDAAARCPRLLAVSVQVMDSDDTAVGLAVNALLSNKKHTRPSGWRFQLPLVGHVQLQQQPLLTLRMRRIRQEPARMLVPLRCSSSSGSQGAVASRCLR